MPKKILTETSKPGFQPWNHEEFLADRWVKRMSSMERKTYATLLHEAFFCSTRPYLPSDEEELEVLADCDSAEEWLSIRDNVLKMFERIEVNGVVVLCSKRVEQDWERMLESRNLRSTRAKTAAQARHKQAQADQNDAHACQVRERVIEEKESEQEKPENGDGQDDMKIKNEIQAICVGFGVKPGGFKSTWDEVNSLATANSVGAVVRDFEQWMGENQGDDFPRGPVSEYLRFAASRIGSDKPSVAVAKDPQVNNLVNELTYLSGKRILFKEIHKVRIGELLNEYSFAELVQAFKDFTETRDLDDTRVQNYGAKDFVDAAGSLAYANQRARKEAEKSAAEREQAVRKLQEQAEAERLEAKKLEESENDLFDPLA